MNLTIIDNNNIFQKDVIGNVRKAQEDSHDIAALTPNGDVFVVCDGMGGHVGGKQASSIAVRSIIEHLKKEKYPEPLQAINDALQFANMQIIGYANEHPELRGMGTTACVVLLQNSEAYIAHVGDSRIYLYLGKEKQLHRITKDHSYVQTLVDAGQITDEEAEHHPNKNRILKALGIRPDLAPSFDRIRPKNGDVFMICSDGLSGMISDSVMRDVLMQNTSIESKGNTLVALALEAGGLDNITVELIHIANSPHSKSTFRNYNPAKPQLQRRSIWKLVTLTITAVFFALTLCGLLLYNYSVAKIERQLEKTRQEIENTDSLIFKENTTINDFKYQRKELSKNIKEHTTNLKNLTKELKEKHEEQHKNIAIGIETAKNKIIEYEKQRDSLEKAYDTDSIRLAQINWRNKIKRIK